MPYEFKVTRRVEFSDTDMAGLMHFSNFFRFVETAEHAFFRSLGFSIATGGAGPGIGWPRVHARCDFLQPLRFEDEVEIRLLVAEKRSKAITYEFRLRKLNANPPVLVARGSLTVVCTSPRPDGSLHAVPIPNVVADQLEVAPSELLL